MFSGIVEEMGVIQSRQKQAGKLVLRVSCYKCLSDLNLGDSIAINGVCLTVVAHNETTFVVEAIPETCRLTNLVQLNLGAQVNLERAISASSRIGGHFVQGHVDGTTQIKRIEPEGDSLKVWFEKPKSWKECVIPKGFIAIDGMSLTVVDVLEDQFSICFIPHTQAVTIAQKYQVGTTVNLEVDHLTKTIVTVIKQMSLGAAHG
jgi:riboflavin synthase